MNEIGTTTLAENTLDKTQISLFHKNPPKCFCAVYIITQKVQKRYKVVINIRFPVKTDNQDQLILKINVI